MPWDVTPLGNVYTAVDGEGVKNDYVLLDSSIPEFPRLYKGRRLTSLEILDWLWELGRASDKCTYVLYGAGYDYNNWVRDLGLTEAKAWAKGAIVQIGPYMLQYMRGFRFELRKVKSVLNGRVGSYERIRTNGKDLKIGMLFYDVLPFWQKSFIGALEDTLGEDTIDAELIEEGKALRGEFTHDMMDWVTRYNEAECYNLVEMMNRLDTWFSDADIHPRYMNGPGAAAKDVLKKLNYTGHNGRDYSSGRVRGYIFPGIGLSKQAEFLDHCLAAYAGGRNQHTGIGFTPGRNYQIDKISAYPSACIDLPCLTHGKWTRVLRPSSPKAFGIYRISYSNAKGWLHPYFVRTHESIIYPSQIESRWIWNSELQAGIEAYGSCTQIHEGWEWVPEHSGKCDNPFPLAPLADIFKRRKQAKADGNVALALILKLPLNSVYGSMAQSRGGTLDAPPPTQQILWAGWITGAVRGDLFRTAMVNPDAVCHLATDGIISTERLDIATGDNLGDWEISELNDLMVVGYGIYAGYDEKGKFKYRTRGFTLRPEIAESFFKEVRQRWANGWDTISVEQKVFVTAGLAHEGLEDFNPSEWCTWKTVTKQIQLSAMDQLRGYGKVESVPGMFPVRELSNSILPKGMGFVSDPYSGNWGVSQPWPDEITPESEYGVLDWN